MQYLLWALLLIVQNMAFTWVSRARNSKSIGYHAIAAVFSNGVWFASQFILIGIVATKLHSWGEIIGAASIYIVSTVIGSVLMHHISLKYLEKGKRQIG
jgi:hypothetical protein